MTTVCRVESQSRILQLISGKIFESVLNLAVKWVFRTIPAGRFAAFRPAVSLDSGHPFRSIPATPV
jgi:hypothetical protein